MLSFRVAAADLLIGANCAGCGRVALTLCERCRNELMPHPHEAWPDPPPPQLLRPTRVTPVASASHEGAVRAALAAYKERGRFGLLPVLSHLLAASLCRVTPGSIPVTIVPVPSSRRASTRRGYDAVADLARAAASAMRGIGLDCRVEAVLAHSRRVADQSELSARARADNMRGAMRLVSTAGLAGRDVVVVDDVLTTGATMVEAVGVLSAAGARPVGIAVIAATVRRSG